MTQEKSSLDPKATERPWVEQWRLQFEVDGLIKEELTGLMRPEIRRDVGRKGLFLYSEHSLRVRGINEVVDVEDATRAEQLEAFSERIEGLRDIGFGRLFTIHDNRVGLYVRSAAHIGNVATSALRRDANLASGRGFLSGPSTMLRFVIPHQSLADSPRHTADMVQRTMNMSFYGTPSGGVSDEADRVRNDQSTIRAAGLSKYRLNQGA